jgi:asparagine synthetase B (glutamine-hydrolysing)
MCGIFGSVGEPIGPEIVARVIATLHHRGPDLAAHKHGALAA